MFMLCGCGVPLLFFVLTTKVYIHLTFLVLWNAWIPLWMCVGGWPGDAVGFAVVGVLMVLSMIGVFAFYKTNRMRLTVPCRAFAALLIAGVFKMLDQPLGIHCEGTALFHIGTALACLLLFDDMTRKH